MAATTYEWQRLRSEVRVVRACLASYLPAVNNHIAAHSDSLSSAVNDVLLTPCLARLFVNELPRPLLLHVWDALFLTRGAAALTHGCLALLRAVGPALLAATSAEECLKLFDGHNPSSHRAWAAASAMGTHAHADGGGLSLAVRDGRVAGFFDACVSSAVLESHVKIFFDARKLFDDAMLCAIRDRMRATLAREARAAALGDVARSLEQRVRALRVHESVTVRDHGHAASSVTTQLDALAGGATMRAAALGAGMCADGDGHGHTAVRRLLPMAIEARAALDGVATELDESGVAAHDGALVEVVRASMVDVARLCKQLEEEEARPVSASDAARVHAALGAHRRHAQALAQARSGLKSAFGRARSGRALAVGSTVS